MYLRMRKREDAWAERKGYMLSWGSLVRLWVGIGIPAFATYTALWIVDSFFKIPDNVALSMWFGAVVVVFVVLCYFEDRQREQPDEDQSNDEEP